MRQLEFVRRAGGRVLCRRAETVPEDADKDVAVRDPQDGVYQTLRPVNVKARISIFFPSRDFEHQTAIIGDVAVHPLHDIGQGVALRPHVAGDATTIRNIRFCSIVIEPSARFRRSKNSALFRSGEETRRAGRATG